MTGAKTGRHTGRWVADSDGQGVSFYPHTPFAAGETVTVVTHLPICGSSSTYHFSVARPPGQLAPSSPRPPSPPVAQPTTTYVSMPGVQVPDLKVVKTTSLAGADIFETPTGGTKLGGPEIVNQQGQLVWFAPLPATFSATDLKVETYKGKPVLTFWKGQIDPSGHGLGEDIIMNSHYQVVATIHAGNGYQADLHAFRLGAHGKTAWLTAYSEVGWNLKSVGGSSRGAVWDSIVQEVDIATGNVLFEWHSLDHVAPSRSYISFSNTVPYDYFHVNAISPLGSKTVVISSRNTDAVYAVDKYTGGVLWTLGGKKSSFHMGKGTVFRLQHDAAMRNVNTISIFDDEDAPPTKLPARGIVIHLNYRTHRATLERLLTLGSIKVPYEGNVQLLPNGGAFIGWGAGGATSAYTASGKLTLDMQYASPAVASYRAYVYKWVGQPSTPPAIAVEPSGSGLTVYASWNGSTQTKSWEVLGGSSAGSLQPMGSAPSRGFETQIPVTGSPAMLQVLAEGAHGQILGRSAVVTAPA